MCILKDVDTVHWQRVNHVTPLHRDLSLHVPFGVWTVCGNGQCELGEACSTSLVIGNATTTPGGVGTTLHPVCCLADCPIVIASCAADAVTGVVCSGHGWCHSGTGECTCFTGYIGDSCNSCANQYIARGVTGALSGEGQVGSESLFQVCTFLPELQQTVTSQCTNGVRDGLEGGIDCGGVCSTSCNGTSTTSLLTTSKLAIGSISALVGALLIGTGVGVTAYYARRRKQSRMLPTPLNLRGRSGRGNRRSRSESEPMAGQKRRPNGTEMLNSSPGRRQHDGGHAVGGGTVTATASGTVTSGRARPRGRSNGTLVHVWSPSTTPSHINDQLGPSANAIPTNTSVDSKDSNRRRKQSNTASIGSVSVRLASDQWQTTSKVTPWSIVPTAPDGSDGASSRTVKVRPQGRSRMLGVAGSSP